MFKKINPNGCTLAQQAALALAKNNYELCLPACEIVKKCKHAGQPIDDVASVQLTDQLDKRIALWVRQDDHKTVFFFGDAKDHFTKVDLTHEFKGAVEINPNDLKTSFKNLSHAVTAAYSQPVDDGYTIPTYDC